MLDYRPSHRARRVQWESNLVSGTSRCGILMWHGMALHRVSSWSIAVTPAGWGTLGKGKGVCKSTGV